MIVQTLDIKSTIIIVNVLNKGKLIILLVRAQF